MAGHLLVPKRLIARLPSLRRLSWWIEAQLLRAIVVLLRCLPTTTAFAIATRTVRLLGPLLPMRERALRNIRIVFAELSRSEQERICEQTFASLGAACAELALADRLWREREQRFEFSADPSIEGLREGGRPMVMVTAHVGAWQLSNLVGARYPISLTSLYSPESNPYIATLALRLRSKLGARWESSRGGIRRLLEELRQGHSVGIACDTRLDQGEAIPFFGHDAMTNTVPARLALREGCELVPVRVERLPGIRFRITLEAPVRSRNPQASQAEQARDISVQLNERYERWIREAPGEWMCLARRWPSEIDKAVSTKYLSRGYQ